MIFNLALVREHHKIQYTKKYQQRKNRPSVTSTETADTSEDAYIYFTCKNIVSSSDSLRNRNMFSMAVIFVPKIRPLHGHKSKEDDFLWQKV